MLLQCDMTAAAITLDLTTRGMWDVWHARESETLFTFTVLTTFPNEISATVHDRIPLIIQPKDYARWLDRENADIADILAPYPGRWDDRVSGQPASQRSEER